MDRFSTTRNKIISKALKIRAFETYLLELFSENKIGGTTHTCLGQEMSGAIVGSLVLNQDIVISNHRCHGHYLGLTNDYLGLAQELLGQTSGVNYGVGGSQHIALPRKFYSNGIQGGMVSYSAGLAKNINENHNGIVVNFLGDGTFGEGALYEGINLARSFKCPVLFLLENNKISQSTNTSDVISGDYRTKFEAFGIQVMEFEHNDIDNFYNCVEDTLNDIRKNKVPKAIIWNCNRLGPHSKGDDTRSPDELKKLWSKDFLKLNFETDIEYEKSLKEEKELIKLFFNESFQETTSKLINSKKKYSLGSPNHKFNNLSNSRNLLSEIRRCLDLYLKNIEGLIIGEDLKDPYGGAFKVTKGLMEKYPNQFMVSPISESGIIGFASGYSSDNKPIIVEIMFGDFITLIADQVINHCSKFASFHGETSPSIIIRTPIGGGRGYGATHSQNLEKIFGGIPNVVIEQISFMHNIEQCYQKALNRNGCTIISEPKLQYSMSFQEMKGIANKILDFKTIYFDDKEWLIFSPINISPEITLICTGSSLPTALKASEELFLEHEIFVNIICPRQTSPILLSEEIVNHIKSKVLVIDETFAGYGFCETMIAEINMFINIKKHIKRYCLEDGIYPSSLDLEKKFIINKQKLLEMVLDLNEI